MSSDFRRGNFFLVVLIIPRAWQLFGARVQQLAKQNKGTDVFPTGVNRSVLAAVLQENKPHFLVYTHGVQRLSVLLQFGPEVYIFDPPHPKSSLLHAPRAWSPWISGIPTNRRKFASRKLYIARLISLLHNSPSIVWLACPGLVPWTGLASITLEIGVRFSIIYQSVSSTRRV